MRAKLTSCAWLGDAMRAAHLKELPYQAIDVGYNKELMIEVDKAWSAGSAWNLYNHHRRVLLEQIQDFGREPSAPSVDAIERAQF